MFPGSIYPPPALPGPVSVRPAPTGFHPPRPHPRPVPPCPGARPALPRRALRHPPAPGSRTAVWWMKRARGGIFAEPQSMRFTRWTARNMTLDAALAEAAERYAAGQPGKRCPLRGSVPVASPGGNTRTVLFYDPFPLAMAKGEGARLRDLDGHEYRDFPRRVHGGALRTLQSPDPRPGPGGARRRDRPRGPEPLRGGARRAGLRPLPLHRPGAVLQLRNRGEPDGHRARPRGDGGARRCSSSRARITAACCSSRRERAVR